MSLYCTVDVFLLLGWVLLGVAGLLIGLLGGGGSILAVPILVHLFGQRPTTATGDSLLIVGTTACIGAFTAHRRGETDLRKAVSFAVPSSLGAYLSRRFLVPGLPDSMAPGLSKDKALMLLFVLLMAIAGIQMLSRRTLANPGSKERSGAVTLVVSGLAVGVIAGLVGAGGGFLIVPALVLLVGMPPKTAVGTSMAVIAAQSLVGFAGELQREGGFDTRFLALALASSLAGLALGLWIAKRTDAAALKPLFGKFILLMAMVLLLTTVLNP